MPDYSCGATKQNNGPNGWNKTMGFSGFDFGLPTP